jgi:hypothetical protein
MDRKCGIYTKWGAFQLYKEGNLAIYNNLVASGIYTYIERSKWLKQLI